MEFSGRHLVDRLDNCDLCDSVLLGGARGSILLVAGLGLLVLRAVSGCDPEAAQDAMLDRELRAAQVLIDYRQQNETALAQARSISTVGWPASAQTSFSTALSAYQEAFSAYNARESELHATGMESPDRIRILGKL